MFPVKMMSHLQEQWIEKRTLGGFWIPLYLLPLLICLWISVLLLQRLLWCVPATSHLSNAALSASCFVLLLLQILLSSFTLSPLLNWSFRFCYIVPCFCPIVDLSVFAAAIPSPSLLDVTQLGQLTLFTCIELCGCYFEFVEPSFIMWFVA